MSLAIYEIVDKNKGLFNKGVIYYLTSLSVVGNSPHVAIGQGTIYSQQQRYMVL